MNILIKNMSNTLNYGSMMMGENLIKELIRKAGSRINFYIDTTDSKHVMRLKDATLYSNIFSDTHMKIDLLTKNIRVIRYFEKRLRNGSVLNRIANFYQAIIILGGDDYAETYFNFPRDNLLFSGIFNDIKVLSRKIPVFMLSQSIGPFSEKREGLVSDCLANVKIFSRDPISHQYVIDKLGLNSILSADLAFLDLFLEDEKIRNMDEFLLSFGLIKNQYFVVVGTGLISHYSSKKDMFVSRFLDVLRLLHHKYPDFKIVYLSHVVNQDSVHNDVYLFNLLKEKDKDFIEKYCIEITKEMLPVEARIILGGAKLNISCRMHAVVSSLHMGIPAIALSYSKKYKGVISEGMDLADLVIDAKGDHVWTGNIVEMIDEKINHIFGNYDQLTSKIKDKVQSNKEMAQIMIDDVINQLMK